MPERSVYPQHKPKEKAFPIPFTVIIAQAEENLTEPKIPQKEEKRSFGQIVAAEIKRIALSGDVSQDDLLGVETALSLHLRVIESYATTPFLKGKKRQQNARLLREAKDHNRLVIESLSLLQLRVTANASSLRWSNELNFLYQQLHQYVAANAQEMPASAEKIVIEELGPFVKNLNQLIDNWIANFASSFRLLDESMDWQRLLQEHEQTIAAKVEQMLILLDMAKVLQSKKHFNFPQDWQEQIQTSHLASRLLTFRLPGAIELLQKIQDAGFHFSVSRDLVVTLLQEFHTLPLSLAIDRVQTLPAKQEFWLQLAAQMISILEIEEKLPENFRKREQPFLPSRWMWSELSYRLEVTTVQKCLSLFKQWLQPAQFNMLHQSFNRANLL
jgi:hypothetical protein